MEYQEQVFFNVPLSKLEPIFKKWVKEVLIHNTQPQHENEPENDFITRDEVCRLLSFNKTTLYKHTKSGKLLSFGIGNRVLYSRKQVLEAVKPINH